jgi:hypothetical protein
MRAVGPRARTLQRSTLPEWIQQLAHESYQPIFSLALAGKTVGRSRCRY